MEENTPKIVEIRKGETNNVVSNVRVAPEPKKEFSDTVKLIRSVCVWTMIVVISFMTLLALTAVWIGIGAGNLFYNAIVTAIIVGFGAGIIMLVAPALDQNSR